MATRTSAGEQLWHLVTGRQLIPSADRYLDAIAATTGERAELPEVADVLGTGMLGTEPETHCRCDQSSTQIWITKRSEGGETVTY